MTAIRSGIPAWRILVVVFLPLMTMPTRASQEADEIDYLFAGMSQERRKLKSWSCTITGEDRANGSFEMQFLSNGDSVRFKRTRKSAPGDVIHACDNRKVTVIWDVAERVCSISHSTAYERRTLYLWDPRTACLSLPSKETDYQESLDRRLEAWEGKSKVLQDGAYWTITVTHSHEFVEMQEKLTIDTARGFTPVLYRADTVFKANSEFPGKTEFIGKVTAKWEQFDGVWVPVHHRETDRSGRTVKEYKVSWQWVNKEIDEKEFTIDGLGVPDNVRRVDFR